MTFAFHSGSCSSAVGFSQGMTGRGPSSTFEMAFTYWASSIASWSSSIVQEGPRAVERGGEPENPEKSTRTVWGGRGERRPCANPPKPFENQKILKFDFPLDKKKGVPFFGNGASSSSP
mmetsp:Transcript_7024/g.12659  ORF Transcript_7024/g.12659 Transcript_7024/m.12659 type:complete len:119 (-) Transcript_7024:215-571(-)